MRDLLTNPGCRPEDLGQPLPDNPHAVSVAMPLWDHVVGYEEFDPKILAKLKCGYPRFFLHPFVKELFRKVESDVAKAGEKVLLCPSEAAANRCCAYIQREAEVEARTENWRGGMVAAVFPEAAWKTAFTYWRVSGEIISSRRAQSALDGRFEESSISADAKTMAKERLAKLNGQSIDDIFLYPSGIAATFAAHRLAQELAPGRKTIQLEFPYVDALKVQEEFGGVEFLPNASDGGVDDVQKVLYREKLAAVFCEVACNPQLRTANLAGLSEILRPAKVPLIVDDTISSVYNVDVFPHADIVTTSLTKFFSGKGDVLAGCLILNRDSPFYPEFSQRIYDDYEDHFWSDDAFVLESNSRNFSDRMAQINTNAEIIFDHFAKHQLVEKIWYPKNQTPELYQAIQRDRGGFGGLFSLLLKDGIQRAKPFYDALQISKGPSLGTDFTLASPYMFLAHYPELDWADGLGIDRHLIRFSIGLEDPYEIIYRIEKAL